MFLDFYIGKIQNCHQKRKVVIEMNIPYREFAKRVPPPSTRSGKIQARSAFLDEKGRWKEDDRMLEKQIERKLVAAVHLRGGMCPKWVSPGLDGVPDRVILFPGGRAAFVETKAPGKKLRPLQVRRKAQLEKLGFRVFVIDALEQIEGALDAIQTA